MIDIKNIKEGQLIYVVEILSEISNEVFTLGNLNTDRQGVEVKRGFGIFIKEIDGKKLHCADEDAHQTCIIMIDGHVGWCFLGDFIMVDV